MTAGSRAPHPGEAFLHPVALVSLALLLVNDHVLKIRAPGVVSGKLSDVGILVVGPLLLQGLWECAMAAAHRPWEPSRRALAVAVAVTGAAFTLEKTLPAATQTYQVLWGSLRWPLDALGALLQHGVAPRWAPVAAVTDPTDLWTLPALALCAVVHQGRCGGGTGAVTIALQDAGDG
ncbi:MAG: hypothetical protein HY909_02585 [Deltaproteobacteria bacterium]|nr:hypothetical protein [Deltaproteobacteria bacterium]